LDRIDSLIYRGAPVHAHGKTTIIGCDEEMALCTQRAISIKRWLSGFVDFRASQTCLFMDCAHSCVVIRGWPARYHRFEIVDSKIYVITVPLSWSDHSSHLDALCLLAAVPLRKLHRAFPAAAADYFF